MSFNLNHTLQAEKEIKHLCKKYPSFKKDLADLLDQLEATPRMGTEILKDCYKIEMAIKSKNKGKKSGARIITFFYAVKNIPCLLSVYDKSEQVSIKDNEVKVLVEEIKNLFQEA